jgi:hypothetical protein
VLLVVLTFCKCGRTINTIQPREDMGFVIGCGQYRSYGMIQIMLQTSEI